MKKISIVFIAVTLVLSLPVLTAAFPQMISTTGFTKPGEAATAQTPQAALKPAEAAVYDEKADAKADIAAAIGRASKENRRVLIQWGANWCGWCRQLHKLFKEDKSIAQALLYEYDVVLVDIGKFDKNLDVAGRYKAFTGGFKEAGVPYLTILDGAGNLVVNQETSSLEAGQGHDPKKILDFLTKNQAPYLQAGEILDRGLAEAKASGRRVFFHFGAPWCGWCKKLEAWMAQDPVAALLKKDFVDVKIDQDRMIGGMEMKKKYLQGPKKYLPPGKKHLPAVKNFQAQK